MNRKSLPVFLIALLTAFQATAQPSHGQGNHGGNHGGKHGNVPPIAPDPAPKPSDLTADQVVAKSIAARGGEQKLKGLESVTMAGTWETHSIKSSPITLTVAPGRYLRRIDTGAGGVMVKALDEQGNWEVTPQLKIVKPTPMHEKEAARFRRLADPQGPLVNAKAKGNKVEMVGKMPWKGNDVYKLRVTFPDNGVNYVYVDAKSFLPVRVVNTMYVAALDREVVIEFLYEDYRDVNGIKWPFVEKATAPDVGLIQTTTWKTIDVNKPVDVAAFKAPKS